MVGLRFKVRFAKLKLKREVLFLSNQLPSCARFCTRRKNPQSDWLVWNGEVARHEIDMSDVIPHLSNSKQKTQRDFEKTKKMETTDSETQNAWKNMKKTAICCDPRLAGRKSHTEIYKVFRTQNGRTKMSLPSQAPI